MGTTKRMIPSCPLWPREVFRSGSWPSSTTREGTRSKPWTTSWPCNRPGELLKRESVILYEAAVRHRNLFVRADILIKKGSTLELIEVKSKSFRGSAPEDLLTRDGRAIPSRWAPYLYDVAFQKHVLSLAFPDLEVRSYLLLADKNASARVDGLNQRFLIYRQDGRSRVRVREGTTRETLGEPILIRVPVDRIADLIFNEGNDGSNPDLPFAEWVEYLAEHYQQDRKIRTELGSKCKKCEFRCTAEEEQSGLKSGFKECWREQAGLKIADFAEPLVIDLWRSNLTSRFIEQGIYLSPGGGQGTALSEASRGGWRRSNPVFPRASASACRWRKPAAAIRPPISTPRG